MTPLEELRGDLPGDVLVVDAARMEKYRRDHCLDRPAGAPLAVVRPETTDQVRATMRWASRHRIPVVPRGAGTSLSGGATAVDDGIVLSTERMRSLEVDPVRRLARVGPGILNAELKRAAEPHGLWYPPDPGSYEISSIGGNIATNAGGLCCVKYGVTGDYVLGLEVVLADGRLIRTGGETRKDVAGLNLRQLFVGSEGTLGIVTGAVLRLVPAPGPVSTLVALFPDLLSAGAAVNGLARLHTYAMVELMDRTAINHVEDLRPHGLDRTAGAMLLVQSDAAGDARSGEIADAAKCCTESGAAEVMTTDDPDESAMFVAARRASGAASEARGILIAEDICVPIDRLPPVLAAIERIAAAQELEIPVVAHAGDGNLHPGIIYPPGDVEARARAHEAYRQILALALEHGGTVTGEHGVGTVKRDILPVQLGTDALDVTRAIKSALDPDWLLNPGVLLDDAVPMP